MTDISTFAPSAAAETEAPPNGSLVRDGVVWIEGPLECNASASAESVRVALAELADRPVIEVRINSTGGSAMIADQIYAVLRESRTPICTHIEDACSGSALIAMAGAQITIAEHGRLAIHLPYSAPPRPFATAKAMREIAASLDRIERFHVDVYARRTGKPREELHRLLDVEAEYHGAAAVEAGFADRVVPDTIPHNCPRCGETRRSKLFPEPTT